MAFEVKERDLLELRWNIEEGLKVLYKKMLEMNTLAQLLHKKYKKNPQVDELAEMLAGITDDFDTCSEYNCHLKDMLEQVDEMLAGIYMEDVVIKGLKPREPRKQCVFLLI